MKLSPEAANLQPSLIREMSRRRGASTIDLTLGQPGQPPDRKIIEAALEAYWKGAPGYTENAGLIELREMLASHYSRKGPESVLVTVGSEQAVYLTLSCLISPGDEVLVPEPGYPAYPAIVRFLGGVPIPYPISVSERLMPSVDEVCARGTDRTRVLIWNSPSNPFGSIPGEERTLEMVQQARKRGWVFISDEIYRDLVYQPSTIFPSDYGDDIVMVSGLSKSCSLTGFRLGYVLAPSEFIAKATLANQLMVTCAPRLSQLMALEIFRRPEQLTASLPIYRAARHALLKSAHLLPSGAELYLGPGAFYAVLDVSQWAKTMGGSMGLALRLIDSVDVAVVPGIAFGPSGDWFWRLSYAGGADSAEEGLGRIAEFLSQL